MLSLGHVRFLFKRSIHTLIARGEVQNFKKCKFQATIVRIDSAADVKPALVEIANCPRVAKATHPHIAAWRSEDGAIAGFTDCGEVGAGRRLLTLLENKNCENTLVSVTRWYGGAKLGPSRFRAINSVAKEILSQYPTIQ